MTNYAKVPLSFEPWYPIVDGVRTYLAHCQGTFHADRLLVAMQGGNFEVWLKYVNCDEPEPWNDHSWAPAEMFDRHAVGNNVDLVFTPKDVICLHVRFTKHSPRKWWRRFIALLLWWRPLPDWMRTPQFQALLLGTVN